MKPSYMDETPPSRFGGLGAMVVAGCVAFILGIGLSFGYIQWQAQQAQIQELSRALENIQLATKEEEVTRAENVDLLDAMPKALEEPVVVAVVMPEPVINEVETSAEIFRALVEKASAQDVTVPETIADAEGLQVIAFAIQGMNELIDAANAGNFTVRREPNGVDGDAGQTRLQFPDHAISQSQVEQLLAVAAAKGMIPYNQAQKESDGSFNGHAILLDLVAKAL
ncbi:hypothetical protein [Sulfitobacter sp.]|uniref:hypothetical protein n=1 Tax=Sulfitobacter sp. TaxID=1903071 RepID=UPI003002740D